MTQKPTQQHEAAALLLGGVRKSVRTEAPLYSSRPQAGFPAPGDDQIEKVLDINDLVVKHPATTFFVRVEGDSMEGAGIFSGELMNPSTQARNSLTRNQYTE